MENARRRMLGDRGHDSTHGIRKHFYQLVGRRTVIDECHISQEGSTYVPLVSYADLEDGGVFYGGGTLRGLKKPFRLCRWWWSIPT